MNLDRHETVAAQQQLQQNLTRRRVQQRVRRSKQPELFGVRRRLQEDDVVVGQLQLVGQRLELVVVLDVLDDALVETSGHRQPQLPLCAGILLQNVCWRRFNMNSIFN